MSKVDLNGPPIGAIRTMDELIAALKRKAEAIPAGGWVVGWGYDDTLLAEAPHPTRSDLDRVSTRQTGEPKGAFEEAGTCAW